MGSNFIVIVLILSICCVFLQAEISIEYLNVVTQIQARFATTIIVSKIKNDGGSSKEVTFTADLPDSAFISNFTMFINDKIVVGDVKEKEAAKIAYDRAKARGESAGHIAQKPRETNVFQISVNVAASSKAVFNLTYQDLLKRVHGVYKHIINLQPDQTVEKVQVDVFITERGEIKNFHVPKFAPRMGEKTNKELLTLEDEKNALIKKNIKNEVSNLQIVFKPTQSPLAGQMVVLYDVDRAKNGGEIEVVNGYFVHFIAPDGLKSGTKHVIFVLDKSGSMQGRKMEQLKIAMKTILSDLDSSDKFNILMFSSGTEKWKSESVLATHDNVESAKDYVDRQNAEGSTALNDALVDSLKMLHADSSNTLTSMLMFMTDGQPTEGETVGDKILSNVDTSNTKHYSIFSIAFGDDADYNLLKRVSGKHRGLARKIYEDSDAALQMTGFFDEIRSPLLTEVKIDYLDENVDISSIVQDNHHQYYDGGELVIVGKLKDSAPIDAEVKANVLGTGAAGSVVHFEARSFRWICPDYDYDYGFVQPSFWRCCPPYAHEFSRVPCCWPDCCWGYYDYCLPRPPPPPPVTPKPKPLLPSNTAGGFMERMWAYQSIKKLLKQADTNEFGDKSSLRQKALDLSLKYHFVTELTSMVVIDPTQNFRPIFEKPVPSNKADSGSSGSGSGFTADKNIPAGVAGESAFGGIGAIGPAPHGGGGEDNEEKKPLISATQVQFATTTTRVRPISTPQPSPIGCSLNLIFVIDSSGDVATRSELARKTIDQLGIMFSQTTFLSLLSVSADGSGKAALLHISSNVISDSSGLKDATRQTPSSHTADLSSLIKDAFDKSSQASHSKQTLVLFAGTQSMQYATKVVNQLKKSHPSLNVMAVTTETTSGATSKDLETLAGSALNVFSSPQAVDLADSLKC